ncbi:MAG: hemerythrin domain-containing protein [Acidimicrobiales bacterium]
MADILSPSTALSTVLEVRERLHQALVGLEAALAEPAAGRTAPWAAGVRERLRAIIDVFAEHVTATEGPGGLYDDIGERAPRLSRRVAALREEHGDIADAIADVQAALAAGPGIDDDGLAEQVRRAALRLLGLLTRHRQRGADLTYQAYHSDIGGAG